MNTGLPAGAWGEKLHLQGRGSAGEAGSRERLGPGWVPRPLHGSGRMLSPGAAGRGRALGPMGITWPAFCI